MTAFLLPVLTTVVLVYVYRAHHLPRRLFLLFLIATVIATAGIAREWQLGEREQITALPGDSGGAWSEPVPLVVETEDGKENPVRIRVTDPVPTAEELRAELQAAADELETKILGNNTSLMRVSHDLSLPGSLQDGQIALIWTSSRPDVLSAQGVIGRAAEKAGSSVVLTALLSKGEETLSFQRTLKVFPSEEAEAFTERLQEEADTLNAHREKEYRLPETVDGQALTWYRARDRHAQKLCLLLLAAAVLTVFAQKQKEEDRKKKRQQELRHRYPEILSKTHLLLAAGLSLRHVFERLASDAGREQKRSGKRSAVGEELQRAWYDMEHGVLEVDALTQFGERCALAEYKAFALLLAQNQTRGGHRLLTLLETEVQQAFEERKRQARIAGEKTAIRLAVPMGLMLVVVLILILAPALLSFS